MELYLFIVILLILFCIALLVVLKKATDKNKSNTQHMIDEWQKQNKYMDNTVEICEKALELTAEVRQSIESAQIGREESCIEKCDSLLVSINGADTALGVLIFEKKHVCIENDIEFIDNISFIPSENQVKEIDSVSIMGNVLDNAIEAAILTDKVKTKRYINVISACKKNVWIIKVTNSKNDLVITDKDFNTTKSDKENHGHGINIIRMIAYRYNGEVDISDKRDSFEVSIYITMKRSAG